MIKGSLVHNDYAELLHSNKIINKNYLSSQIQPSSIDLTLSEECYEIKASFLSPNNKIREKLDKIIEKKINNVSDIIFSPVYKSLKSSDLADWILEDKLNVRMQLQLHKIGRASCRERV